MLTPSAADTAPSFDFVTADDLREALESDLREMDACLSAGANKAAQVLAGSILEALLVDHLESVGYEAKSGKSTMELPLGELLSAARQHGIITGTASDLASVVRDFRNLIHPGRLLRLREEVNPQTARIARDLVGIVTRSVARAKAATYGYTAKQIVRKVESDASATAIIGELLREAPPQELERLVVATLPNRYLERSAVADALAEDSLTALSRTYHAAMDMAPEETRRKAMARYVRVLKEEPQLEVLRYEEAFFRARDLHLVGETDARIAKAHLLDQVQRDFGSRLEYALTAFGSVATREELGSAAQSVVEFVVAFDSQERRQLAERVLRELWRSAPPPIRDEVPNRIESWYNGTGPDGWKLWLQGLGAVMGRSLTLSPPNLDDLPV